MYKYVDAKNPKYMMYLVHAEEIKLPFEHDGCPGFIFGSKWDFIKKTILAFFQNGSLLQTRIPRYNEELDRYEYSITRKLMKVLSLNKAPLYFHKRMCNEELKCALYPLDRDVAKHNFVVCIASDKMAVESTNKNILSDKTFIPVELNTGLNLKKDTQGGN